MPFAQKNYNEKQGVNGRYRISQIGCFLTSFSNLMERFGKPIDPLQLNALFRDNGIYRDVDDGIVDDLSWNAIQRLNPNIVVTGTGYGVPKSNESIVKFTNLNSTWKTHFSLVADIHKGTIIDSWDGQVKSWNVYGGPKAFASYEDRTPKPTPPPITPPAPQPTPTPAQPQTQSDVLQIKALKGWGISYLLKAAGYGLADYSNPAEWLRFSALNGAPEGQNIRIVPGNTYKVHRTPLPPVAPVPVDVPAPAAAPAATPDPVIPPAPAPEQAPVPTPVPEEDKVTVTVTDWRGTAVELKGTYTVSTPTTAIDLEGNHEPRNLSVGTHVEGAQVFEKDGHQYVRTQKSVDNGVWYGIPIEALSIGNSTATAYVGPLIEDDIPEINLKDEVRETARNLSPKEMIVNLIAKLQGLVIRFGNRIKNKK